MSENICSCGHKASDHCYGIGCMEHIEEENNRSCMCLRSPEDLLLDERDALKAENERLRKALEKYADEENWESDEHGFDFKEIWQLTDHGYAVARKALGIES